ncbi:hypothetical protein L484_024250 [Morus notabilis]|uniref:AT-rich interactive domain-containing protein 2 n=2 Tax=Morus notabilis TaxID=981085 RepID=W9QHB5_9ROSA|nr:hypothetical protein L484_024250 [Morus notabilis]
MHPSMYEDNIALSHHSSERSRCSKRLTNLSKSRSCSCCNPCSPSSPKLISPRKVEVDNEPKEEEVIEVDLPVLAKELCPLEDESVKKDVSVGPLFQADVPEWTGVVYESDPKWLGTRVWPKECREHKYPIKEINTIGKGRPEFCGCPLPGSVECVRFHIAEARMKLKLELGPAFYHWRFDHMGEEVSLRWTAEQEKRFREIVKSNKYFGDRKIRWFPMKTMENMVSYYFNVFLVQKRRYQNRVTLKNIDSDDDEKEFGSIGGPFGNNAVDLSGSNMLSCVQNKQCTDLE